MRSVTLRAWLSLAVVVALWFGTVVLLASVEHISLGTALGRNAWLIVVAPAFAFLMWRIARTRTPR